jgi:hypothetical protein
MWGFLPLVAAAFLVFGRRDDKFVILCAIYAFAGFLVGVSYFGGAGVDVNAMFDAGIALALVAGLALSRFRNRNALRIAVLAAFLLPLGVDIYLAAAPEWREKDYWLHPMADEANMAVQDTEFLRAHRGPALCETLAFCYWAGKPPAVDVFNAGQQFATNTRNDVPLIQLIDARKFSAIQFDTLSPFALGHRVREAVNRSYRVDHTNDDGVFLVPR